MTTHKYEVHIDAPPSEVWDVLADFGGVWRYNPNALTSHSLTQANGGVGAERHCDLTFPGASVQERIVEWVEGKEMVVEIYDGQKLPPVRNLTAVLGVRPDGDGAIAYSTMSYETRFGPIGWLMDKVVVSPKFGRAFGRIVAGLKHYVETGEAVEDGTRLQYDVVSRVAA